MMCDKVVCVCVKGGVVKDGVCVCDKVVCEGWCGERWCVKDGVRKMGL